MLSKDGNAAYWSAAVALVKEVEQLYETKECVEGRRVGLYRMRNLEELLDLAGSLLGRPARHLCSSKKQREYSYIGKKKIDKVIQIF